MKKPVKIAIQLGLLIAIGALTYFLLESIMEPIRFDKARKQRYNAAKERLIDIRTMQDAYKAVYGEYTGSFDTLVMFIKSDSFAVEKIEGSYVDLLDSFKVDEAKKIALERGIYKVDTTKVPVIDSLFKKRSLGFLDSINIAPFTGGKKIHLKARRLPPTATSTLRIPVFEAYIEFDSMLWDLDQRYVSNYKDDRKAKIGDVVLKVGDYEKASNNNGNWE